MILPGLNAQALPTLRSPTLALSSITRFLPITFLETTSGSFRRAFLTPSTDHRESSERYVNLSGPEIILSSSRGAYLAAGRSLHRCSHHCAATDHVLRPDVDVRRERLGCVRLGQGHRELEGQIAWWTRDDALSRPGAFMSSGRSMSAHDAFDHLRVQHALSMDCTASLTVTLRRSQAMTGHRSQSH